VKTQQVKKRFKVGLSFPGERRALVADVARQLASQFGEPRVLYDQYHRAEFARPNLDAYLPKLYHDECELIVAFLCQHYSRKDWCGLEWRAIRDLIKDKSFPDERIMLIKLDDMEISRFEGLQSIDGYLDAKQLSPSQITDEILKRVAFLDSDELTSDPEVALLVQYLRGGAHSLERIRNECFHKSDAELRQIIREHPLAFEEVRVKSAGRTLPGMRLTNEAKTKLALGPVAAAPDAAAQPEEIEEDLSPAPALDPVEKALQSSSIDVLATLYALTAAEKNDMIPLDIRDFCDSSPFKYYGFTRTAQALRDLGVFNGQFSGGKVVTVQMPDKINARIEDRLQQVISAVKHRPKKPRDLSAYHSQIKAYFRGSEGNAASEQELETDKTLVCTIGFTYLPDSPVNHGWKLHTLPGEDNLPRFEVAHPAPREGCVAVRPTGRYALDYGLHPAERVCGFVEFSWKPVDEEAVLYVYLSLRSADSRTEGKKWLAYRVGPDSQNKDPRNNREWEIQNPGSPLENGWVKFTLDIAENVRSTWGSQGWIYGELVRLRIRGGLELSPIKLLRKTSAKKNSS